MIGLDVGGYHGEFIPRMVKMGCTKVYCFEPHTHFHRICETVANQCQSDVTIEVINKALHEDSDFYLNILGDSTTLFDIDAAGASTRDAPKEKINGISFETFIKEYDLSHIDLIKMNCEGSEFKLLEDLLESGVTFNELLVQFHHNDDQRDSLIERFIESGYDVWTHQRWDTDNFVWWTIISKGKTPTLEQIDKVITGNEVDKIYEVEKTKK